MGSCVHVFMGMALPLAPGCWAHVFMHSCIFHEVLCSWVHGVRSLPLAVCFLPNGCVWPANAGLAPMVTTHERWCDLCPLVNLQDYTQETWCTHMMFGHPVSGVRDE